VPIRFRLSVGENRQRIDIESPFLAEELFELSLKGGLLGFPAITN
jgi:hypothetical protein